MRLYLSAFLLLWEPASAANELLNTLGGLTARGVWAFVELAAHISVAVVTTAAGVAYWNHSPNGARLAQVAVALSAARVVQSLWWSVLPHDVKPGDEVPMAAIAIAHAVFWFVYLRRRRV
jgi:hypothetical protein